MSNRNITTDSFFTSVPLAEKLWEEKLTILGTMRKNKPQIPSTFQPSRSRDVLSSQFLFRDQFTLMSYVPKKNKSVVLLSSQHHSSSIDTVSGKPEMILDYNKTKGAVDTVDHLVSNFSCCRRSNKWPINMFYFLLDAIAYNSLFFCSFFSKKTCRF